MCLKIGVSGKEKAPRVSPTPRDPAHSHLAEGGIVDTIILAKNRPEVHPDDERTHGCYDGWMYLGVEAEDESGEIVEVIERVPCRRSHAAAREAL